MNLTSNLAYKNRVKIGFSWICFIHYYFIEILRSITRSFDNSNRLLPRGKFECLFLMEHSKLLDSVLYQR